MDRIKADMVRCEYVNSTSGELVHGFINLNTVITVLEISTNPVLQAYKNDYYVIDTVRDVGHILIHKSIIDKRY